MVLLFFFLGELIDAHLHDHPVTLHFKLLAGLAGAGLVLFLARTMRGIFVRQPIRSEDHL